jgi:Mrp family chromosome partitioning ATPase
MDFAATSPSSSSSSTPSITSRSLLGYLAYSEIKHLIRRIDSLRRGGAGPGSFTILSEYPGEGRSFFSAVLAAGLANLESNRRCLLVDASAQFPAQSTLLNRLTETLDRVDIVRLREDEGELKAILEGASGQYEHVIVDTCALSRHNRNNLDPVLLARQTTGAILLSSRLSLGGEKSELGRGRLAEAGVKLLGIVYNERAESGTRHTLEGLPDGEGQGRA